MSIEESLSKPSHYKYKKASHESFTGKLRDLRPFMAASFLVSAVVIPLVLKYIPNNLDSETVKPPSSTERVVEIEHHNSSADTNIAK